MKRLTIELFELDGRPSDHKGKILLPSVSTSLGLAAGLGIAETIAVSIGAGFLMNTMGVPAVSLA